MNANSNKKRNKINVVSKLSKYGILTSSVENNILNRGTIAENEIISKAVVRKMPRKIIRNNDFSLLFKYLYKCKIFNTNNFYKAYLILNILVLLYIINFLKQLQILKVLLVELFLSIKIDKRFCCF